MKTRPWPLVFLAICQIISPAATILVNAWGLGVSPAYVLQWILEKPLSQIIESLVLMPVAGLAIWRMRTWSYIVFLIAMIWSLAANLRNWEYASHRYPIGLVLLMYALQFGLAIYFMIPSVRRTYLDPRVRWWEAKRRFELEIPLVLSQGEGEFQSARLLNLSEGGVLVEFPRPLNAGDRVRVRLDILGVKYEAVGQCLYTRPASGSASAAYGIQFEHDLASERHFQRLTRALELIGIRDRDAETRQGWRESLADWIAGVFRGGKGLVPEVGGPRAGGKKKSG